MREENKIFMGDGLTLNTENIQTWSFEGCFNGRTQK